MRRFALCLLLLALLALPAAAPAAPAPESESDRIFYTLGMVVSQNLALFDLSPAELEMVMAGLRDGVLGKASQVDLRVYGSKLQELQRSRVAAATAQEKKAGEAVVAKAAAEPGAVKTAAGAVVVTLREGSGASPQATDKVRVHYHGTLADGTVFDSTVERGQPVGFALNRVIPCWTEGVQRMKVGGKARLVCPSATAYGDHGAPPRIKPGATLLFEVELLEIVK